MDEEVIGCGIALFMLPGWGSWQALVTPEKPLPIRLFWKGCKPVPSQILLKDYLIFLIYMTIFPRSQQWLCDPILQACYIRIQPVSCLFLAWKIERMGQGTGDTMSTMRSTNSLGCLQAQKWKTVVWDVLYVLEYVIKMFAKSSQLPLFDYMCASYM